MPSWSLPLERQAELMDDPALPASEHLIALDALARINAISFTVSRLVRSIERLAGDHTGGPLTVVDLACGGGDVACGIARRLAGLGRRTRVIGVDMSQRAVDRSIALAARLGVAADFMVADVLEAGCPPCDVAFNSLFLHHLDDADARRVLVAMAAAARRGVVVSDLVRSRLGLAMAVVGCTVLSTSRVARVDGPQSVRAGRTVAEYRSLLERAGLAGARVRRHWPERVLLEWRREAGA